MNSQRSPREIVDLVWSRRLLVAGIALSVFFAAIVFSFFLPRKYESFTKVRVVDNKALYDIYGRRLGGAKDGTERIRSIHEELLSRKNIGNLIKLLGLDRDSAGRPERERLEDQEAIVLRIQRDTVVDLMETTPGQFIFRIAHTAEDPALAQRVVTHLSTGYRNQQYEEQTLNAARNLSDVREKIREAEAEHDRVTADLVAFEEANSEHRFGQANDTPGRLNEAREKFDEYRVEAETLEQKLLDIRQQLGEEPEFKDVVQKVGNPEKVDELERELRGAEQALAELLQKYTSEYPAVIAQQAAIDRLRNQVEAAKTEFREVVEKIPNPIWAALRESERNVQSELTVKYRYREDAERKVETLEGLVKAWPELNTKWQELTGRRKQLQSQLLGLRHDEESAEVTYSTKAAESAIIFDVLDPPVYPLHPSSPNRMLIAVLGLLVGLAGGVGWVFVLEFFDRSFRHAEEVAAAFDVPVLGAIGRIETLVERDAIARKRRTAVAVVAVLLLVAGAAVFLQIRYDGAISSFIRETVRLKG